MGVLSKIFSVGDPSKSVAALGQALDGLFTSKEEKLDAAALMERIRQAPHLAQTAINQIEAQHRSIFVAGWRPFIGWVCGAGICNHFLVNPWLQWAIPDRVPPQLDIGALMSLVTALLGLGVLRTYEKQAGVTR